MARPQQEACSRNILSILILANIKFVCDFFFFFGIESMVRLFEVTYLWICMDALRVRLKIDPYKSFVN